MLADEKIDQLIEEASQPFDPKRKTVDPHNIFYKLKDNPNDPKLLLAEYAYYNRKYKLDSIQKQLPICVISPGRNLYEKNESYKPYIDSMAKMNYTNFYVIYTDDMSDDGTADQMKKYIINNYPLFA